MAFLESIASSVPFALMAALGIGLVIFVHEWGHFIAARVCGVRVDVFSIGFGPSVFAWTRGVTTYQLALIPMGGYVKMAGEDMRRDGLRPDDRDPGLLHSKTVGQRFLIYSGGVLMNVAFGIVVFPILFAVGVPFTKPVLGEPIPGGAAWHARIPAGTEVLSVDGNSVFNFLHIQTAVALGDREGVDLEILEPGAAKPRTVTLVPDASGRFATVGIQPNLDPDSRILVAEESRAFEAGLRNDDRVVSVVDGVPGLPIERQYILEHNLGRTARVRVAGPDGERVLEVPPEAPAGPRMRMLGIRPPVNFVADVRSGPVTDALGIQPEDRILAVGEIEVQREGDLRRALLLSAEPRTLRVSRGGLELDLSLPSLGPEQALAFASDLHVVGDIASTQVFVTPQGPAADAGLRDGDRILRIDDNPVERFTDISGITRAARGEGVPLALAVHRSDPAGGEGTLHEIEVVPGPIPGEAYGFVVKDERYVFQTNGPLEAIYVGGVCSWRLIEDLWLTLKGMLLGDVSPKELGGIITISKVSYSWAADGWAKLFFFLCMLSINLAFLNVLPIPVLDGGHLFFLIVEKLKGSPVSDRVLAYSQMVGLVLILSLMVYVTFNDIERWFFPN